MTDSFALKRRRTLFVGLSTVLALIAFVMLGQVARAAVPETNLNRSHITVGQALSLTGSRITNTLIVTTSANGSTTISDVVGTTVTSGTVELTATTVATGGLAATNDVAAVDSGSAGLMLYLPVVSRPLPELALTVGRANSANGWTLFWEGNTGGLTGLELQESHDPNFEAGVSTIPLGAAETSTTRTFPASTSNIYYYRIRGVSGSLAGPWSNIGKVVGAYYDEFVNDTATQWRIVRQDTDDIDNSVYVINGRLNMEMNSRWDFQIVSPLVEAPPPPYRIHTYMRFKGVDNLHSYGIIFGATYDGSDCPNVVATGCFSQYYRMSAIWYGSSDKLRTQLKIIEFHDPQDNAGRGRELIRTQDNLVKSKSEDWQEWFIDVGADGRIELIVDGRSIGVVYNDEFINNPYFGLFSATDEYTGLDAQAEYFRITPK